MRRFADRADIMTVQELIDKLIKIEDKSLKVQVSTGHRDRHGRHDGGLMRVSQVEDWQGKSIRLFGEMQDD